jgi:hypothetical protein
MVPVLIVAGFLGLYYLIEKQKQTAAVSQADALAEAQTPNSTGAPSLGTNIGSEMQIESMAVGAGVSAATNVAQTLNDTVAGAQAIPIVGAAIGAVANILLAQHTARLKGATNENQAADQIIPAFDADLEEIVAAYNAGTLNGKPFTGQMAAAAFAQVDQQVYAYLKKQVGAAGTAWDGTGVCSKSCTVGCCLYYNDLHSAIYGPSGPPYNGNLSSGSPNANGAGGLIPIVTGQVFAPSGYANGRGNAWIPTVYPPTDTAYGNYQRPGYFLTLIPPGSVITENAGVLKTLGL